MQGAASCLWAQGRAQAQTSSEAARQEPQGPWWPGHSHPRDAGLQGSPLSTQGRETPDHAPFLSGALGRAPFPDPSPCQSPASAPWPCSVWRLLHTQVPHSPAHSNSPTQLRQLPVPAPGNPSANPLDASSSVWTLRVSFWVLFQGHLIPTAWGSGPRPCTVGPTRRDCGLLCARAGSGVPRTSGRPRGAEG